tara:strand:- start:346 stop:573 length:228 start_codon:yes stop_codon:yes gene_type:complete
METQNQQERNEQSAFEKRQEKIIYWYSQVDGCSLDGAVDALFGEINDQMREAGVPAEFYQEVFRLVNDDYTIRRN